MNWRPLLAALLLLPLGSTSLLPLTASAAAERGRQAAQAERIDYPGSGIVVARQSGDQRRLKGTPRSLKRFVAKRLEVLYADAGSRPRCATSPTVVVDRYDSRGFVKAGEGWYEPCPGGGYSVIYKRSGSKWRAILGSQDVRFCQDLAWWGVPVFIGGRRCLSEDLDVVRYRPGAETVSPEATARRVIAVATWIPIVPRARVVTTAALAQLESLIGRRTYLAPDDCAPEGCVVTATEPGGRESRLMLRMQPIGDDLVVTEVEALP